jgi:Zn-dependent protease with chaperone function
LTGFVSSTELTRELSEGIKTVSRVDRAPQVGSGRREQREFGLKQRPDAGKISESMLFMNTGRRFAGISGMETQMVTHNADRLSAGRARPPARGLRHPAMLTALLALILTPLAWSQRTPLKPGWNMFSPQQDIEMGQQVSRDAEQQVPMLNDARVDNYLNNLGRTLASHTPGEQYSYQYKCVNDRAINAFALPGGFVYINRGVIEAADNEAQLAGVMAHETSHVALRHGTNQASKAYVAQVPLAILGGALGNNNSMGAILAQLGADFATNSLLLKYSRTAESQADEMGTQILYDSGYDPRAMGQFFEKIQAEDKSGRPVEFFSNHPNPDNRLERVDQEVNLLGGSPRGNKTDSREFQEIKRYVLSLPAPRATGRTQSLTNNTGSGDRGRRSTLGLRILSARYGAQDRFIDVRQLLQSRVQNDRLSLQVTNASMGSDPIKARKSLLVNYSWAGRTYDATIQENQWITIPTEQQQTGTTTSSDTRPGWPSDRVKPFENSVLRIEHPDNWQAYGQGDIAATITPDRGMVDDGQGNRALAYGVIVNMYELSDNSYYQNQLQPEGYGQSSERSLEEATNRLIEDLRRSNQGMRIIRSPENIRVDGQRALSTDISNESPLGGRETDWLITVPRPEGLLFFVFVAPDGDFQSYNHTFRIMLDSVRFRR